MAKRSARKKSKNIFARLIESIIFLLVIMWKSIPLLIAGTVFYFAFFGVKDLLSADPYFQITSIKIFPRGILTDQEYQALERRSSGVNLLKADLRKVSAMIEANPKVKLASAVRKLPGELEIFLAPRQPAFQLRTSPRGVYYTLGDDAVVMAVSDAAEPSMLQFSHFDYPAKKMQPLDRYEDAAFQKLGAILDFLKKNDTTKKEKITAASVDKTGNFTVMFDGGPEILLRDMGDLTNQKMTALANLLGADERRLIAYIDLRHLDIILKYK